MTLSEFLAKYHPNSVKYTQQQINEVVASYFTANPIMIDQSSINDMLNGTGSELDPLAGTQYKLLSASEKPAYEYLANNETAYEPTRLVTRYKTLLVYLEYKSKAIELNKNYNPQDLQRKTDTGTANNTILYIIGGLLVLFLLRKK